MDKLLLTVDEAAQALGIGRANLFKLLGAGVIGSVKLGRLRRIPATELERYVASLMPAQPVDS